MTAGHHLHHRAFHFVALVQHGCTNRDRHLGADAEPQIISHQGRVFDDRRRLSKPPDDLRARDRQMFSGANIERHALPAPGINFQF